MSDNTVTGGPSLSAAIQLVVDRFERTTSKVHDHEGNLVGYVLRADVWREMRSELYRIALDDRVTPRE